MTITTDPDSVDASTRTRQTMSMVIDTVLVNVQRKDEKTVENECVSKSDPEDSMQNEPTQVSDELRAKIRAMLADTL